MLLYQILVYIMHGKIQEIPIITINLKYQLKRGIYNHLVCKRTFNHLF